MKNKIYSEHHYSSERCGVKNLSELEKILSREKKRGKKIVTCSGAFDLLHPSHVDFLEKAKKLGDILAVFLNSDSSVRKSKGSNRPIYNQNIRARMLSALTAVDFVLIFGESNCIYLLRKLRPDIFAQGQDWGLDCIERPVMKEHGGEVKVVKVSSEFTTSNIINKLKIS